MLPAVRSYVEHQIKSRQSMRDRFDILWNQRNGVSHFSLLVLGNIYSRNPVSPGTWGQLIWYYQG